MPLAALLKISEQAVIMRDQLNEWANPKGGRCVIMATQRHIWEELADLTTAANNEGPRLMLICSGADLRLLGEPDCRREDRHWQLVIVRGRGFYKDPLSGHAVEPFTDSIEALRDLLRCITSVSDEEETPSLKYRGWKSLSSILPGKEASAFADGAVIDFDTANDLPLIYPYTSE